MSKEERKPRGKTVKVADIRKAKRKKDLRLLKHLLNKYNKETFEWMEKDKEVLEDEFLKLDAGRKIRVYMEATVVAANRIDYPYSSLVIRNEAGTVKLYPKEDGSRIFIKVKEIPKE